MVRFLSCVIVLGALSTAHADATTKPQMPAKAAEPPKPGDKLGLADIIVPKAQWLYDLPSPNDAAGKVVVHWFCSTKIAACSDDLARIITLRDSGRAYIVAYIDGGQRDAKKLDPIRESEGVGRGTVGYGPNTGKLMKQLALGAGPASIVVDVDGKVASVAIGGDATTLDARDAKVNALITAIKEYAASYDGPKTAKPNDKFALSIKIQLASWLKFKPDNKASFTLAASKDLKCERATKIDGQILTATATCAGPKGNYEAQGKLSWGYTMPGGGDGLGEDGTTWKFTINP